MDALLSHHQFSATVKHALRSTNSVERINKEFKRRSKSMDSIGEMRLKTLLAFTAMRLELGWRKRGVDTFDQQITNVRKSLVKEFDLESVDEVMN